MCPSRVFRCNARDGFFVCRGSLLGLGRAAVRSSRARGGLAPVPGRSLLPHHRCPFRGKRWISLVDEKNKKQVNQESKPIYVSTKTTKKDTYVPHSKPRDPEIRIFLENLL